jgi:hypothetical protein
VQLVGCFPAVAGGRQICQFTVVVVEPEPAALNCWVPRSTTVAVVGVILTATFVELPPQPINEETSNAATPTPQSFIHLNPSIASPLNFVFQNCHDYEFFPRLASIIRTSGLS